LCPTHIREKGMAENLSKVENLIKKSLKNLNEIGEEKADCSQPPLFKDVLKKTGGEDKATPQLIFPIRINEKKRVSEQEIRFLFVKELENQTDFYYSVETPTKQRYSFTGKRKISGNIDVCLYEKVDSQYKRVHLIEFKALNPSIRSYEKDFQKLFFDEENLTNYFIQILENADAETIPNIENKYNAALDAVFNGEKQPKSNVIIFLYSITKGELYRYENFAKNKKLKPYN